MDGNTSEQTYFLTDHLGSTRALTDSNGNIVQRYDYTPYGQTTASSTAFSNPYQYTGRELDQSGLYYYRARYYSPEMGRFISEDPIGLAGGINAYAYVGGNPVQYVDHDGRSPAVPVIGIIVGTAWATYQGYQAGKLYGREKCRLEEERRKEEMQARTEEIDRSQYRHDVGMVQNGVGAFGPVGVKVVIGIAVASITGNALGFYASVSGTAAGAYLGYSKNCSCDE